MAAGVRPLISPEFVAEHRRLQVANVIASLASEGGLRRVSVNEICGRGRMGRAKFYALFDTTAVAVDFALLWAYRETTVPVDRAIREAREERRGSLEAALPALFAVAIEHPQRTELCLVHSVTAHGNRGRDLEAVVEVLRSALADRGAPANGAPGAREARAAIEELLARSILTVTAQRLREGRPGQLGKDAGTLLRLADATLPADPALPHLAPNTN